MDLKLVYIILILLSLFIGCLLSVVMWLTTARYFDNLLRSKNIPLPPNYAFNLPDRMGRGARYAVYIFKRKPGKRDRYRLSTGEFDFRQHARKYDIILSFIISIYFIIFILIVLLPALIQGLYHAISYIIMY